MIERNSIQNILRINKAYNVTHNDNLNNQSVNLNKEIILFQMKPKNHKFHTKNSIGQQFLETRYDVMNKNFIRLIKREIRKYFEEYLQTERLKNTANSHLKNCQLFALYLLESTSVEWGNIIDFNIKTFRVYLMALTNYCKLKRLAQTAEEIKIKEKVFNLLYSFSHTRFYSFIQTPEIRFLILIIKERYTMDEFINQICHSHYSSYRSHISSLFKIIRHQNS